MEALIQTTQLILSLSLLVIIHELGHFMFAKLFGARVEKFYLFFNPWFSIFKFKKGETEYGLGWVPFGGYVKISGMIDESMDKEQMKQEPQPYEFRSKPAWQRLLIMIGGVLMNLILAIIIYTGISYTYGQSYIANKDVKGGYQYSPTAQKMGFENGDKILNVDGKVFDSYRDITVAILFNDAAYVEVERNGESKKINIDKTYFPELLQKGNYIMELRIPLLIDSVLTESPALNAGLQKNDRITSVDSIKVDFLDELNNILNSKAGETVAIEFEREANGQPTTITSEITIGADSIIGIYSSYAGLQEFYPVTKVKYSLLESIPQGVKLAVSQIDNYLKQLKLIFTPETEAYKSVGSVISMGSMFSASWDWLHFWSITAILSVMLGVLNILPIPALDGGHVLFLLYEVVTRRKPSDKFMEYTQTVGVFILLAIMVFALGNDILKLFS